MDDKDKIKILDYWCNNPENAWQIPDEVKGSITDADVKKILAEMEKPNVSRAGVRTILPSDYFNHAERLRNKLKLDIEIENIESNKKLQKTQIEIQNHQTDILHNTFFLYLLTIIVIILQAMLFYLDSQFEVTVFTASTSFALLFITGLLVLYIWSHLKNVKFQMNFLIFYIIVMAAFAVFIILAGREIHGFPLRNSSTNIVQVDLQNYTCTEESNSQNLSLNRTLFEGIVSEQGNIKEVVNYSVPLEELPNETGLNNTNQTFNENNTSHS